MKRVFTALLAGVAITSAATLAMSQPPGRPGGPGPDGPPPNPILEALDANGDHEISAEEIENAVAALKKLDENGDGKLSRGEVRPFGPGGPGGRGPQGRGPQGRGPSAPDGSRPEGRDGPGRTGGGGDAAAFVERILSFDKNEDGKVSKGELPERMQGVLDRHDTNEDGALDKAELGRLAAQSGRARDSGSGGRSPEARGRGGARPEDRGGRWRTRTTRA